MGRSMRASLTIEAVFVVSITIFIIMTLCYGAFYMHDKSVMASYCQYQMDINEADSQQSIINNANNLMYITEVSKVRQEKNAIECKTMIQFSPKISIPIVRKLLLRGRKVEALTRFKGRIDAVCLKWDYDILEEQRKEKIR